MCPWGTVTPVSPVTLRCPISAPGAGHVPSALCLLSAPLSRPTMLQGPCPNHPTPRPHVTSLGPCWPPYCPQMSSPHLGLHDLACLALWSVSLSVSPFSPRPCVQHCGTPSPPARPQTCPRHSWGAALGWGLPAPRRGTLGASWPWCSGGSLLPGRPARCGRKGCGQQEARPPRLWPA